MANKYGEEEYRNISGISVSHIYNLKKTVFYRRSVTFYQESKKTKGRTIGERCKPEPGGKPGYLRVDAVHQGDRDGEKGVYHINTVDEVVQWEVVGVVKKITDCHLIPLLEKIIGSYPYRIINFHLKVKQNSIVKAGLFSIVEKQKNYSLPPPFLRSFAL